MPILDIDLVGDGAPPPDGLARQIADAAGAVLRSEPNGTWVRLRSVSLAEYAENGDAYANAHPVLVSVIKAHLATPDELATEAAVLASAIAEVDGRVAAHIHAISEPARTPRPHQHGQDVVRLTGSDPGPLGRRQRARPNAISQKAYPLIPRARWARALGRTPGFCRRDPVHRQRNFRQTLSAVWGYRHLKTLGRALLGHATRPK